MERHEELTAAVEEKQSISQAGQRTVHASLQAPQLTHDCSWGKAILTHLTHLAFLS